MNRSLLIVVGILFLSGTVPAQIFLTADLSGANQVPPVATPATGTAWALLDPAAATLTYEVTYARLESAMTAAHFHSGAPGVSGVVLTGITFTGNTAAGIWSNIPDTVIGSLLKGSVYINIHSANNPDGEIRGQLKVRTFGFSVSLDGAQSTPPNASMARGTGWVTWDRGGSIFYRATIAGLTTAITGSHFHSGAPGVSGPVVQSISFGGDSTTSGQWLGVSDNNITNMAQGNLYINVHTSPFPNGEIRGQVNRVAESFFPMKFDGSQQNPPVTTTGAGTGWAVLNTDMTSLKYQITYARLESTFSASHFHLGFPGADGGVIRPITFQGNTAAGEWTNLPDSIVRYLLRGGIYVNIHSVDFPLGEIRSQVSPLIDAVGCSANLDGVQETPPNATTAKGTGFAFQVHFDTSIDTIYSSITIAGLSSALTGAHIHNGPPGIGGPIVHPLTFVDSTVEDRWATFTNADLADLAKGNLYFNVHSGNFPAGEIRGQILLGSGTVTSVQRISDVVPKNFRLDQNYPNPFNPSTTIGFDLSTRTRFSLKLFNVLGQEIRTLLDDVKDAGRYRVTFNAAGLPSGIYFYRLAGDGGLLETKKMVFMK